MAAPYVSHIPHGPDSFALTVDGREVATVSRRSLSLHASVADDDEARAERQQSVDDWDALKRFLFHKAIPAQRDNHNQENN